jgi:hypothetical protein
MGQQPNQLQAQPPGLQQAPPVASVEANRADPVKNSILNPEVSEAASAASAAIEAARMTAIDGVRETPTSPTTENSNRQSGISEVRNVQVIARAQAMFDFAGEDEGDLPFKVGDIINVIEFCKFLSVSRLLFKAFVDVVFVLANSQPVLLPML